MAIDQQEHLSNMLARLERERQEGAEDVHLSRAEARAIYLLVFPAMEASDEGDQRDRFSAILTKMGGIGWPA